MRRMSAVPGFGDLLQIPIRMPDLVSSEKRKQGLALVMKKSPSFPLFQGGGRFHFHIRGRMPERLTQLRHSIGNLVKCQGYRRILIR